LALFIAGWLVIVDVLVAIPCEILGIQANFRTVVTAT
jgi:hypothetical protein